MNQVDAVIIGAGAAGLFCAGIAQQRGLQVALLDHSLKLAEKIRISGGGRANFTNRNVGPDNYLGGNTHFCRSALSRYTPQDFTDLMQRHGIPFHEKHKGQLFCDRSAEDLINMLLRECDTGASSGSVQRRQPCQVHEIRTSDAVTGVLGPRYEVATDAGTISTNAVVIATGGLSIPKIGASDFGYRIAHQFGLRTTDTRPALVPLTFDEAAWRPHAELAGLSMPVIVETGSKKQKMSFAEDLLFTHRGLSGPAILQISSYWQAGDDIRVNLAPGVNLESDLLAGKTRSRKLLANELANLVPARLATTMVQQNPLWQRPINEVPDRALAALARLVLQWQLAPNGSEGYRKAEVTAGGVDTRDLSSQTMESKQAGLYFIGEVVDVTGWLGGYNFQWAWSSAYACAMALPG